jgi:hypothetical protein
LGKGGIQFKLKRKPTEEISKGPERIAIKK